MPVVYCSSEMVSVEIMGLLVVISQNAVKHNIIFVGGAMESLVEASRLDTRHMGCLLAIKREAYPS